MTPDYIPGLDDPQDAPVPSLEERLVDLGYSYEEIAACLLEPERYARTHGARQ